MDAGAERPKYARWVRLLAHDQDHLREARAPAYWRLAPYYVGQIGEAACSLASATMVANGLRGGRSVPRLVSQDDLLTAVGDRSWRANVRDDGRGATLVELEGYLRAGLAALGISGATVTACPMPAPEAAALGSALADLEAGRHLMIAHVGMAELIGDEDYGHFSPVGAWDERRERVLILDVYRVAYEPYWVPFDRLLAAMATRDRAKGEPRGFLSVTVPST
jgi:hypothetical protein